MIKFYPIQITQVRYDILPKMCFSAAIFKLIWKLKECCECIGVRYTVVANGLSLI